MTLSLPSPSHDLPKRIIHPPKDGLRADLRRPITAWRALVWTYRDEHVRAATNASQRGRLAETGYAAPRYGGDAAPGGLINGVLEAHQDAHAIDHLVANWFDEWPLWRQGVAVYAEKPLLPPHPDDLPPFRILGPVLNADGKPKRQYKSYGHKGEGYLCPLLCEGLEAAEIQRHREFHALFHELLRVMQGLVLVKWKIIGPGA